MRTRPRSAILCQEGPLPSANDVNKIDSHDQLFFRYANHLRMLLSKLIRCNLEFNSGNMPSLFNLFRATGLFL